MAETTKISWCNATASPWHGCEHAVLPDGTSHPGCLKCYAEKMSKRNPGTLGIWGANGTRVKSKTFTKKLQHWNKQAAAENRIVSVFPSICDPFEDRPELAPWRREMYATIDRCPNVRMLLLTKRPQNARRMTPAVEINCQQQADDRNERGELYRRNVWIGVSASEQWTWDWAMTELSRLPELGPVRFVSLEPFLGPVDAVNIVADQVIIGCESDGPRVGRLGDFHSEAEWIEAAISVVRQCRDAGKAAFVKQIPLAGRCSHVPAEWPEALRIQEFPEVKATA